MKIGIPVNSSTSDLKKIRTCSLHNSDYLGIYDLKEEKLKILPVNNYNSSINQEFVEILKLYNISAVISSDFRLTAIKQFRKHCITPYKADGDSLHENIERFRQQKLNRFSVYDLGNDSACAADCTSCLESCR
ncbi:MAG: hypothetical protein Q8928_06665 [Bacteroidota bacterium]|nr:hypothetical protein [Bacteroidota bacterium]